MNTLDFTLDSKSDIEYMFQFKQPVSSYDGERLIGVFYIDDSDHIGKGLWKISCKDAIGVLDDDPYPSRMLANEPAEDLLKDILDGQFRLETDAVLASAPVSGYLPGSFRRRRSSKQIAVCACPHKVQEQLVLYMPIDQKQLRLNMTLAAVRVISGKRMVPVFPVQRFSGSQGFNDIRYGLDIAAALLRTLQVLLKACGRDELVPRHVSSSFIISSTSV